VFLAWKEGIVSFSPDSTVEPAQAERHRGRTRDRLEVADQRTRIHALPVTGGNYGVNLKTKKPFEIEITVDDPWSRDIYRRIAAGESLYAFLVTERIHYARFADKAWRAKVEAEAAEARRRRGGRPRALSADQICDARAMVRQYMETNNLRIRWHLTEKVQEYLHERGIHVSDSTAMREVVDPVRGKKRRKERF